MRVLLRIFAVALLLVLAGCNSGGGSETADAGGGDTVDTGGGNTENPIVTFNLSGQVIAAENSAIDRDTNDPNAEFTPNDTIEMAQAINNPLVLAGHVNEAGTGEPGATFTAGDLIDVFSVNLREGQRISLSIAEDGFVNDLDLFLLDDSGSPDPIASSVGTARTELLTAPADGNFFIVIFAFSGASSYVLNVSQDLGAANQSVATRTQWLPGELIVKLKDARAPGFSMASMTHRLAEHFGMRGKGGTPERGMLMDLGDEFSARPAMAEMVDAINQLGLPTDQSRQQLTTLLMRKMLSQQPEVEYAELNYRRYPSFVPDDPLFENQWHYQQIRLPQAWDLAPETSNIIIAVIDTGVVLEHPDLADKLVPGYDFISSVSNAGDGDGIDNNPNDPGDQTQVGGGSSWHGTHVAGTAAADTDNGLLVAGVARNARIMPLRVLGREGGSDFDIAQAMRFAAGLDNDSGTVPANRAHVINMSLGGPGSSQFLEDAVADVRQAGVVVVAAAGNESTSQPSIPASIAGVISVSAVDIDQNLTGYSNFGSTIDVAAPGGDASSDRNGDGFFDGVLSTYIDEVGNSLVPVADLLQGTSMASPHVAGVVALMFSVNPDLTPSDIDDLLASGALTNDIGASGRDNAFGYGLINAAKAVEAAFNAAGTPIVVDGQLFVDPTDLNFGAILTRSTLSLANATSGDLAITNISVDQPWITVTALEVDGDNLGQYRIDIDRTGLDEGTYSATITVDSDQNSVQVQVIMQVAGAAGVIGVDAGFHYVLLIDSASDEVLDQVEVDIQDGVYPFSFSQVAEGTYQIWTGTDSDNDGIICDAGEACGAYTVLENPRDIEVVGSLTDLDFSTGISSAITNSALQSLSLSRTGVKVRKLLE